MNETTGRGIFFVAAVTGIAILLGGCQGHLPNLETATSSGPSINDVVDHIQCELATIINTDPNGRSLNDRLQDRMTGNGELHKLLPYLVQDHFVATAQLTLDVTDTEGLNPSLSYMNNAATFTFGLGGQFSGTQDRSLTINYSTDLFRLKDADYLRKYCGGSAANAAKGEGIAGDLGLADIVADGLTALNESSGANIYSSAGPTPAVTAKKIDLHGTLQVPSSGSSSPARTLTVDHLVGTIIFSPQSAGVLTQGTVTLTGVATVTDHSSSANYVVNWTGSMVPQPDIRKPQFFSMTGGFLPAPGNAANTTWGFSPSVTVTGQIDQYFDLNSLKIAGILTPVSAGGATAKPISLSLNQPALHGAAGGGAPAAKGSSVSSGSAGGTSFGSLVDFSLVAGLNGGPNWSFKHFKGPSGGSSPLLSATRTNTNSLSITFVASCQSYDQVKPQVLQKAYWDTIGACDEAGTAQLLSSSIGYENNSLIILKNLIVRP